MTDVTLPTIIAGPLLRHLDSNCATFWVVTSVKCDIKCLIFESNQTQQDESPTQNRHTTEQQTWQVGKRAFINLISAKGKDFIAADALYQYDLQFDSQDNDIQNLSQAGFKGTYDSFSLPTFRLKKNLSQLIHGSCRKAHFHGDDALPQLDHQIQAEFDRCADKQDSDVKQRPDLFLMTGDQVYIDDVAGPMLNAIHQVIHLLGLNNETFEGATVADLSELIKHPSCYYQREQLLPETDDNKGLTDAFFKAKRKPVFTSVNAQNHLIALSEMLALYFLSWSATLWQFIDIGDAAVASPHQQTYQDELTWVLNFTKDLDKVQRALAHVPVYMIFDDHDVTDDWNLTRGWEEQIYGHPFSKRIIGNALSAYFLCQGCGNPATQLNELFELATRTFQDGELNEYSVFTKALLDWDCWHYQLDTQPPLHVLDTRTQRWRSESNLNKPSGLMDWEALCELQHKLIGQQSVIMVSAAPVYGVKFIEAIQKLFTIFGGALTVDAENWMAHRGTANVILNIFRHIKTPPNFIILSGDVHYSFVYDVKLRFRRNSPNITQFTSSGIHNEFPDKLLTWFDRLNRWFYGSKSPLNWLTKRRNMSVKQRTPNSQSDRFEGRTLVNKSNLGRLSINSDASKVTCELICHDGEIVSFDTRS